MRGGRLRIALALATFLVATPVPAHGADSLYWTHDSIPGGVAFGNLAGTGTARTLFADSLGQSSGVALDPAAGKVYWAVDANPGYIRVANLDGSGAPRTLYTAGSYPEGIQIDRAAGKIYWGTTTTVEVADLDGSSPPHSLFTGENVVSGLALDKAAGRVYWGSGQEIRYGLLSGVGGAQTLYGGQSTAAGVALDAANGKIYWTDLSLDQVRFGNLNGSGAPQLVHSAPGTPWGVALDTTGGRLFWGLDQGNGVFTATVAGAGAARLFPTQVHPTFPTVLRVPEGLAQPDLTGGGGVGEALACNTGTWAADLPGAQFYRAPRSFGYLWFRDGGIITGATGSTYTPTKAGSYRCRVGAFNQAGAGFQQSDARKVTASFGKKTNVSLKLTTRASSRGVFKVRITNKNGFKVKVKLSARTLKKVTISRRKVVKLKSKSTSVPAHSRRSVKLKLPKTLRKLIKVHGLRLRLAVKAKDPSGHSRTIKKRVTVKRKKS